jgi:hypothetical protein
LTADPVAYLEPWLGVYTEKIQHSRLGPEFERYARQFTRSYVLRLLGSCSPSEGRELLRQAIEALPGDFILTSALLSTYLGSTYATKILKWGKSLLRKKVRTARRIDLSAPPEKMFENL